jgi:hypothetical protein
MPGPIIVTATDRALFWLAKGLLLSTRARRGRDGIRMVCFDLGLDPAQAAWIAAQDAEVLPAPDPLQATGLEGFQPYMLGQFCRPFLPELLPGHDAYVWLDADTWLARDDALDGLLHVARFGLAACCPEIHPAYSTTGRIAVPTQRFWARAWQDAYGPEAAAAFRAIPMLNSGVAAIPAGHALWGRWQGELATAIRRPLTHLSEQLAFFRAGLDQGDVERLPAHWNWLANFCRPRWHDRMRRWIEPTYPHTPIRILHLAGAVLRPDYLRAGMLFAGGAYLEPGDLPDGLDLPAEAALRPG